MVSMHLRRVLRAAASILAFFSLLLAMAAAAAAGSGAAELRERHAALQPQLATNAFGGPIVLQSEEMDRRVDGHVYAVLSHPFNVVSAALSDPAQWCQIMILHLNTKYCRAGEEQGQPQLQLRVGRKHPQEIESASLLAFTWRKPTVQPDYLSVEMGAPNGPYDTRDYRLTAEAIPLEGGRTFLHLRYALSYGGVSAFAMKMYLGTTGRDKIGFTRTPAQDGSEAYVGGMRAVVERNTMRYYLAIDAYLGSLAAAPAQQLESRLQAWFDATEKYPRQLHELEREDYLRMKRAEVQRQMALR